MQRVLKLNPALKPGEEATGDQNPGDAPSDLASQLATLLHNSTLLKSYESIMQQYEDVNMQKQRNIEHLERDHQQAMTENNILCE